MKLFKKSLALMLCICLLVTSLASCGLEELIPDFMLPDESGAYSEVQDLVSVSIADGEHYKVTSANPVKVYRGGIVSFTVEIDENYEYESSLDGAIYSEGRLIFLDVYYPVTAEIKLKEKPTVIIPDLPTHTHTGGTATCTEGAICTECGSSYTDPLGHDWSEIPEYDANSHWSKCENEGCDEKQGVTAHSGGEATCTAQAVCTECGGAYGILTDHTWEDTLSHNETTHWYGCSNPECDKQQGLAAHSGGEATLTEQAVCDACGTPYGSLADAPPHVHIGGTAGCSTLAICDDCGLPYGEALGHSWSETLSHDDNYHWYDCEREECNETQNKTAHTGGEATYTELAICEICSTPYGELVPIPEFETVILDAEDAEEGYHFICWTVDKPATEGGRVFAKEDSGTFQMPFGGTPIANYADDNHHVILYRTNGGTTANGGKDYYYQTFSNQWYDLPNTILQNGTFVRSGYALKRYTENADGSGDYTTVGGKIAVSENGFVELYLQWGKVTDTNLEYSFTKNSSGEEVVYITGYTGTDEHIVIPEIIFSRPVERIAANAFKGKKIKSLVLPRTIDSLGSNAFGNCTELTELTIHNGFKNIPDDAFSGCTALKTIYLNAQRGPIYSAGSEGMFALKYERIRMAAIRGEKKILLMSGSSSLYGFRAEIMEAAFNDEYNVINYGTNAGANGGFYIDAYTRFLSEGDIVIHAPETTSGSQLGAPTFTWTTFRGTDSMPEVFSFVDMTKYTGFFSALSKYNTDYADKTEKSFEAGSNFLDEHLNLAGNKENPEYEAQSPKGMNVYNLALVNEVRTNHMNYINANLNERGATMYYSFAPVCKTAVTDYSMLESSQTAFVEKMQSMIDYKVISKPADYILEEYLFNNSDYHPGPTGAVIRTEQLVKDLKAQLISEGKWPAESGQ